MKYSDFEVFRENKIDFSRDNLIGIVLFVLISTIIIMGGLMYQHKPEDYSYLHNRIAIEYSYHQHYKRIAEERANIITKYEAERTQIVDISYYTKSVDETDSTPNQTAILTFGFTEMFAIFVPGSAKI